MIDALLPVFTLGGLSLLDGALPWIFILNLCSIISYISAVWTSSLVVWSMIIFQKIIASGVVLCYQLIHCTLQRMHPSSPHCNWWPSCQCWQCHHHCGTANTTTARNVHLDLHQYFHLQWYKEHIEALLPAISLASPWGQFLAISPPVDALLPALIYILRSSH